MMPALSGQLLISSLIHALKVAPSGLHVSGTVKQANVKFPRSTQSPDEHVVSITLFPCQRGGTVFIFHVLNMVLTASGTGGKLSLVISAPHRVMQWSFQN